MKSVEGQRNCINHPTRSAAHEIDGDSLCDECWDAFEAGPVATEPMAAEPMTKRPVAEELMAEEPVASGVLPAAEVKVESKTRSGIDLKTMTAGELEDLLIDVFYEFGDRGWCEEDMIDEVRATYPEVS